jgi:predicted alpha/beta hydrolase family esterase
MRSARYIFTLVIALSGLLGGRRAAAESPDSTVNLPNLRMPTLGGKQFWADVWLLHQYRIQRNAVTGHYRLLDPDNKRQAWGTLEACRDTLAALQTRRKIEPIRGKVVLVMHGLFRSRGSMERMCRYLREHSDYEVINLSYPSTRGTVGEHAKSLASVVESLEGAEEINFVAHSLGNLVIRHWLGDLAAAGEEPPPSLGCMVMLSPPNQQPELALKLVPMDFSGRVAGPAAQQLATGWSSLSPRLAVPEIDFAILAGGRNDELRNNPLIRGDDDWVVSVASTRLPGAADFRVVPVGHTFMMNDPLVQKYVLQFLQHGYFETGETMQPILE